ncbi:MAG: phospholipid scramblase family protein [Myxococcota bacterium]|nr:scramblase [Deltaproteobacteria bacterium]MDQ3341088.1 phospholipid scramblase family protein [Myxococcota bacterium]
MDQNLVKQSTSLAPFHRPQRLSVRQRKNWMEIITSFDARNKYVVYDEGGNPVFNVEEQGSGFGSIVKRLFLRNMRPFTSHVEDLAGQGQLLVLTKPFRFIFHRLEIRDPSGTLLGAIQRRWTWFRRKYIVEGPDGQEVATLFGPIFRPWTFQIQLPGSDAEVGLIQKKWSGLLKEAFSDADNFWVDFAQIQDPQLRAVLFAATVLIDIVHFENRG